MGGNVSGGIGWVVVVNLIIWTGVFVYLLRLDLKLRQLERLDSGSGVETHARTSRLPEGGVEESR
jgi:CcmD family protein